MSHGEGGMGRMCHTGKHQGPSEGVGEKHGRSLNCGFLRKEQEKWYKQVKQGLSSLNNFGGLFQSRS